MSGIMIPSEGEGRPDAIIFFFARTRNNKICFERCSRHRRFIHSLSRALLLTLQCFSLTPLFICPDGCVVCVLVQMMKIGCLVGVGRTKPVFDQQRRGNMNLRVRVICFPRRSVLCRMWRCGMLFVFYFHSNTKPAKRCVMFI